MAFTYLPESPNVQIKAISHVRLHIPDREAPWFCSDAEISLFLADNNGNPRLAAADALESKATDEAFVQKVQTTLGESSNGAATADVVLKRAAMLRQRVKDVVLEAKTVKAGYFSISPL